MPVQQPANRHRRIFSIIGLLATLILFCVAITAQDTAILRISTANSENTRLAARGEYIVNNVAVCGQCHTPRNGQGQLERSEWLEGAALWLVPAAPRSDWPTQAARLAGVLPGTDRDMIQVLTTGIWKGRYLRPPMPQFRMSREDAEAVVAYLKSLNPRAQ